MKAGAGATGYYFSHEINDSFIVVNRLLKAGESVSWLAAGPMGPGTFYVAAKPTTLPILQKAATELGVSFEPATAAPAGAAAKLKLPRIAVFDRYGGNMPSGWTRKILEDFEFPGFDATSVNFVFAPDLDEGNLRAKWDVLILNGAGLTGSQGGGERGGGGGGQAGAQQQGQRAGFTPQPIPPEFAKRQGQATAKTTASIKQFVEEGGTVIAIGSQAMAVAQELGLPVTNHLVENGKPLPGEKYYVPGSVLRIAIDNTNPVAHGLGKELDVFFQADPVFALAPDAAAKNTRSVGWFASARPLRSGWAWGEPYLDKGVQLVSSQVGKGHVYLFAPEVLFRAQPHGAFKLFFNSLYLSVAEGLN